MLRCFVTLAASFFLPSIPLVLRLEILTALSISSLLSVRRATAVRFSLLLSRSLLRMTSPVDTRNTKQVVPETAYIDQFSGCPHQVFQGTGTFKTRVSNAIARATERIV